MRDKLKDGESISSSSFFITRKEIGMKKLEQIRQESKEIKEKIDNTEERLRQLKNQEKKILKQDIVKRRKERTHNLSLSKR